MIVACPDCAAVQVLPPPPERGHLRCWQCGGVLERRTGRSLDGALACAIATFLLLLSSNMLPLVSVRAAHGLTATTRLASGCIVIWTQGWPLMAVLCALQGIILPFLRFGLLIAALGTVRLGLRRGWTGRVFRYAETLDPWAMPDVLLLGCAIGYGRVVTFIPVRIEAGGWCFIGAGMMAMLTRATLDRRAFWRRIEMPPRQVSGRPVACTDCDLVLPAAMEGMPCPRCAARLRDRKPLSLTRTNALVLAAFLLLPVANYFPMSSLWEAGRVYPHTILDGIRLLFQNGYAPLGVVICFTSVVFPLVKLIGLSWMSASIRSGSAWALRGKTRLYRFIDGVGRWSNLDPFTIVIFTPMVQFDALAHIQVGGGSPAFLAVIVISMIAARVFDPRLLWDAAQGDAKRARRQPDRELSSAS